jgi:hypothetical protein
VSLDLIVIRRISVMGTRRKRPGSAVACVVETRPGGKSYGHTVLAALPGQPSIIDIEPPLLFTPGISYLRITARDCEVGLMVERVEVVS